MITDPELERELERLDLEDQADVIGKLTPIEFGRLIGVAPQRVYYFIRTGKIELEVCICGRKVIDVAKSKEVFQKKGIVDVRPDD